MSNGSGSTCWNQSADDCAVTEFLDARYAEVATRETNPAVLASNAAKQLVLDRLKSYGHNQDYWTVCHPLAQEFIDHPDFRPAWNTDWSDRDRYVDHHHGPVAELA